MKTKSKTGYRWYKQLGHNQVKKKMPRKKYQYGNIQTIKVVVFGDRRVFLFLLSTSLGF